MEVFSALFSAVSALLSADMNIYGFHFSFFDVFVWTSAIGILIYFAFAALRDYHD